MAARTLRSTLLKRLGEFGADLFIDNYFSDNGAEKQSEGTLQV